MEITHSFKQLFAIALVGFFIVMAFVVFFG